MLPNTRDWNSNRDLLKAWTEVIKICRRNIKLMEEGVFPDEVFDYIQTLHDYVIANEIWSLIQKNYYLYLLAPQMKYMNLFIESLRPTDTQVLVRCFLVCNIPFFVLDLSCCRTRTTPRNWRTSDGNTAIRAWRSSRKDTTPSCIISLTYSNC